MGAAWDGDFDRCFFVDETGEFVEGYYVLGLLARHFLQLRPGEKIIHDPRLYWNTQAILRGLRRDSRRVEGRPCLHEGDDAPGGRPVLRGR